MAIRAAAGLYPISSLRQASWTLWELCTVGVGQETFPGAEDPALGTEVLRQADARLGDVPRWKG